MYIYSVDIFQVLTMAHETPKNWHIKQNYIIYELVYFNGIIKRTHELQGSDTFACLIWNHVEA